MIKWIEPKPDQYITDIAALFVWESAREAESYTLEYASNAAFKNSAKVTVEQIPGCNSAFSFAPDDMLPKKGAVFARVNSNNGETSEVLQFTCDPAHPKSSLRWNLSPESPYFTILDYGGHEWERVYELLPESLKPYTAFLPIPKGSLFNSRVDSLLEVDSKGIPWHLMAAGPVTVARGNLAVMPLSGLEYLLQHTKNLKSVGLLEQYMGTKQEGSFRIDYFKRVIMLCAKYGIPFFYSDGNRNYLEMASFVKRPVYMNFLREYRDYVVLSYKQNHANAAYTCFGAVLGAWLDGGCAQIGVQGENWYWNDAGFRDDPGNYYGYLQGNEQQIPACMTAQMLLTGLSIGACYYSMEGAGWLIQARGNDELEWSPQGLAAVSLMQRIVRHKLIPSREEVLGKIRAAVSAEGEGEDLGDAWEGGKYRKVFQNIYGIDSKAEIFMKQSRYYYLPLVTDRRSSFENLLVINADDIHNPDEVNNALNPLYPEEFTGNVYLTGVGNTYVIMNSNENRKQSQFFILEPRFPDGEAKLVKKIEGALGLWQYLVMWQKDGILHLHLNAPRSTAMTLRLTMNEEPRTEIRGQGLSLKWDAQNSCLELTLNGSDQSADLICAARDIQEASLREALLYEPVANKPDTSVYLSDFPFVRVYTEGAWMPVKDRCANGTYGKLPACINGLRYPHSFSFMQNSEVDFNLGGQFHSLEFTCGFDIDAWMPIIIDRDSIVWDRYSKLINLQFSLLGDGKALYTSLPLKRTDWKQKIVVDVTGISILSFQLKGVVISKDPGAVVYMDIGNPVLSYNPIR